MKTVELKVQFIFEVEDEAEVQNHLFLNIIGEAQLCEMDTENPINASLASYCTETILVNDEVVYNGD
jgi:hypothetical protein